METYKSKFYNNPAVDPVTDEPIKIGGPRFHELASEYGYPKIRSPKSGRFVDVGKGAYNKLIPDYTHEYLLSRRTILPISTKKEVVSNVTLTKDFVPNLPDDVTMEIIKNMTTYNQLQFCHSNKQVYALCQKVSNRMDTLKYNLKLKTMAISYNKIVIIKNDEIHLISLSGENMEENVKVVKKLYLPTGVLPIAVALNESKLIVLTIDGLYFLNIKVKNNVFVKMTQPPGNILYMDHNHYFSVITTEGAFYLNNHLTDKKVTTLAYTKVSIPSTPYMITVRWQHLLIASEKGLFFMKLRGKNIPYHLDIEGDDILGFNNDIVIATSGTYRVNSEGQITKIMDIDTIPHLKTIYNLQVHSYFIFYENIVGLYQFNYDTDELPIAYTHIKDLVFGYRSLMQREDDTYDISYIDQNTIKNINFTL